MSAAVGGRGILRALEIAAVVCLGALILWVYVAKAAGADERAAIRALETEIAPAQRDLRLLRAEAAHLEQPARLQALVDAHLQLQPLDAEQEASPEVLPVVLPTGQQEPAEATQ